MPQAFAYVESGDRRSRIGFLAQVEVGREVVKKKRMQTEIGRRC